MSLVPGMRLYLRRVRWDRLAGCGGTATLSRGEPLAASWPDMSKLVTPVSGFDIFTPCGVVSTGEICVFVLCLMDL